MVKDMNKEKFVSSVSALVEAIGVAHATYLTSTHDVAAKVLRSSKKILAVRFLGDGSLGHVTFQPRVAGGEVELGIRIYDSDFHLLTEDKISVSYSDFSKHWVYKFLRAGDMKVAGNARMNEKQRVTLRHLR